MNLIIGFIKKEFAQTLRDPVMRVFLFGAPLLQLIIFGTAISNEFTHLRLSAVYKPSDAAARQRADRLYASDYFVPGPAASYRFPDRLLRAGAGDAVLIDAADGNAQLLIDASNTVKARSIDAYARQIMAAIGGQPASGVVLTQRMLFNPEMKTSAFMVPGVMSFIVCLITVILTAMSLAREKEMGTFESMIAAPLRKRDIILGKIVPYIILGLFDAVVVLSAGVLLFSVPVRGPVAVMVVAAIVFVCVTIAVGMLISTISRTQQQAMMGAFLFVFPAIMLSGIMFPIENMPPLIRAFAYANPLSWFTDIQRNVLLKGANMGLVMRNLAVLALMAAAAILLAIRRFRQTLN